jgi:hypothetical protein
MKKRGIGRSPLDVPFDVWLEMMAYCFRKKNIAPFVQPWADRAQHAATAKAVDALCASRERRVLSDNYISPSTTVTSPHPERHC